MFNSSNIKFSFYALSAEFSEIRVFKVMRLLFHFISLQKLNEVLSTGDKEKSKEAFVNQVRESIITSSCIYYWRDS
jgi:hypothetical protein